MTAPAQLHLVTVDPVAQLDAYEIPGHPGHLLLDLGPIAGWRWRWQLVTTGGGWVAEIGVRVGERLSFGNASEWAAETARRGRL